MLNRIAKTVFLIVFLVLVPLIFFGQQLSKSERILLVQDTTIVFRTTLPINSLIGIIDSNKFYITTAPFTQYDNFHDVQVSGNYKVIPTIEDLTGGWGLDAFTYDGLNPRTISIDSFSVVTHYHLDSLLATLGVGTIDSTYFEFTDYKSPDGWYGLGDTLRIDTAYASQDSIMDVTYVEFMTLKNAHNLQEGKYYRITDYRTAHWTKPSLFYNHIDTVGALEPLIVNAINDSSIYHMAYSELYPYDIIYYDPDSANWENDGSFNDPYDGWATDWKGTIYYRHNTKNNVLLHYDYRNVIVSRWKADINLWNSGTTYVLNSVIYYGDYVFVSKQNGNTNHTPSIGDNAWWEDFINIKQTGLYFLSTDNYIDYQFVRIEGVDDDSVRYYPTFYFTSQSSTENLETDLINFKQGKTDLTYYEQHYPYNTILTNNLWCLEDAYGEPRFININIEGANNYDNTFIFDWEAENIYISTTLFYQNFIHDSYSLNIKSFQFYDNIIGQTDNVIINATSVTEIVTHYFNAINSVNIFESVQDKDLTKGTNIRYNGITYSNNRLYYLDPTNGWQCGLIDGSTFSSCEKDPLYVADSSKIIWWADTTLKIATQYDISKKQDDSDTTRNIGFDATYFYVDSLFSTGDSSLWYLNGDEVTQKPNWNVAINDSLVLPNTQYMPRDKPWRKILMQGRDDNVVYYTKPSELLDTIMVQYEGTPWLRDTVNGIVYPKFATDNIEMYDTVKFKVLDGASLTTDSIVVWRDSDSTFHYIDPNLFYGSGSVDSTYFEFTDYKSPDGWYGLGDTLRIDTAYATLDTVTNTTYANLMILKNAGNLIPGRSYRITDFKTVHLFFRRNWSVGDENQSAPIEPLLVTAISDSTISKIAYSEQYPQDIIYYDPDTTRWWYDYGFCSDPEDPDKIDLVSGFKGVIFYRNDTKKNVSMCYDFRHVKFLRYKLNSGAADWSSGTTYSLGQYVYYTISGTEYLLRSVQAGNLNHVPTWNDLTWWRPVLILPTRYIMQDKLQLDNNPYLDFTSNYDTIQCYTFHSLGSNTYENYVYNVNLTESIFGYRENNSLPIDNYNLSILLNNVFYLASGDLDYYSFGNIMAKDCYFSLNTFIFNDEAAGGFTDCTFNGVFRGNIIGDACVALNTNGFVEDNLFGNGFMYNTITGIMRRTMFGSDWQPSEGIESVNFSGLIDNLGFYRSLILFDVDEDYINRNVFSEEYSSPKPTLFSFHYPTKCVYITEATSNTVWYKMCPGDTLSWADTLTKLATQYDIYGMLKWSDTLTKIATQYDISKKQDDSDTTRNIGFDATYFYVDSIFNKAVDTTYFEFTDYKSPDGWYGLGDTVRIDTTDLIGTPFDSDTLYNGWGILPIEYYASNKDTVILDSTVIVTHYDLDTTINNLEFGTTLPDGRFDGQLLYWDTVGVDRWDTLDYYEMSYDRQNNELAVRNKTGLPDSVEAILFPYGLQIGNNDFPAQDGQVTIYGTPVSQYNTMGLRILDPVSGSVGFTFDGDTVFIGTQSLTEKLIYLWDKTLFRSDSVFMPNLPDEKQAKALYIDESNGQIFIGDTLTGGEGTTLWTLTADSLYPTDTTNFVAIGTDAARVELTLDGQLAFNDFYSTDSNFLYVDENGIVDTAGVQDITFTDIDTLFSGWGILPVEYYAANRDTIIVDSSVMVTHYDLDTTINNIDLGSVLPDGQYFGQMLWWDTLGVDHWAVTDTSIYDTIDGATGTEMTIDYITTNFNSSYINMFSAPAEMLFYNELSVGGYEDRTAVFDDISLRPYEDTVDQLGQTTYRWNLLYTRNIKDSLGIYLTLPENKQVQALYIDTTTNQIYRGDTISGGGDVEPDSIYFSYGDSTGVSGWYSDGDTAFIDTVGWYFDLKWELLPNKSATGLRSVQTSGVSTDSIQFAEICYLLSSGKVSFATPNGGVPALYLPLMQLTYDADDDDEFDLDDKGWFLERGYVRYDTWSWTAGQLLYVSTTGGMSHTAPTTSGYYVQVVGIAMSADVILWNPQLILVTK